GGGARRGVLGAPGGVRISVQGRRRVQGAGQQRGGDQRGRAACFGHPPRGVRPALDRGVDEHRAALGGGVGGEPGARTVGQGGVPAAGVQQTPQREIDGQRLAAGAAAGRDQRGAQAAGGG